MRCGSCSSPVDPLPAGREGLFAQQGEIRRRVLPAFRELEADGLAELTASAYYHPILPMLCDSRSAGPQSPPEADFRHPLDASYQLRRGADLFAEVFGRTPRGLWPSEGAISRETAVWPRKRASASPSPTRTSSGRAWAAVATKPPWPGLTTATA